MDYLPIIRKIATEAVENDIGGIIPSAIGKYSQVLQLIDICEQEMDRGPATAAYFSELDDFRVKYSKRMHILKDVLDEQREAPLNLKLTFPVHFEPYEEPPPSNDMESFNVKDSKLCFWFLRLFIDTFRTPGAYVTPQLFISQEVWLQKKCRVSCMGERIQILTSLRSSMDQVMPAVFDYAEFPSKHSMSVLQSFKEIMREVHTEFSKILSFVKAPVDVERGRWGWFKRTVGTISQMGKKSVENDELFLQYTAVYTSIVSLFIQFETKVDSLPEDIRDAVTSFLNECFIPIIHSDLGVVVQKYLENVKNSVRRVANKKLKF
ncbi:hypothetical protein PCE1_003562 [Barthelona sp. PCE]